jgi:hypothetical protein
MDKVCWDIFMHGLLFLTGLNLDQKHRWDIGDTLRAITICNYPRNINHVIATPATTTRLAPTNNPCTRDGSPGSAVA